MKKTGIIIGMLCSTLFCQAQDKADKKVDVPAPVSDSQLKQEQLNKEFGNLPKEQRVKYLTMRQEANRLFSQKRTFEALVTLYEMQEIFDKDPAAFNLFGAISVEFRDFDHARKHFKKALDLSGEDPKILFNLAELAFCNNEWESCLKDLNYILNKIEENEKIAKAKAIEKGQEPSKYSYLDTEFAKIMIFKQMLCHLALAQDESVSAEQQKVHTKKANDIAKKFNYMVDSPFYYYANAALAFSKENKTEASIWVVTAKKVFYNSPVTTSSWDDTLVEFGYIESHYGKHFKEDSGLKIKKD